MPTPKKISFPTINYGLPKDLGECVSRDVELLQQVCWEDFIKTRQQGGELADPNNVENHSVHQLLRHYKNHGVPVKLATPKWDISRLYEALTQGAHKLCNNHLEFLSKEFVEMIQKAQWVVLPASMALELEGLRLSPPGVVSQRDRRPRWIYDYTWSGVNTETLPLAAKESMQFGHALERILRKIILADPRARTSSVKQDGP